MRESPGLFSKGGFGSIPNPFPPPSPCRSFSPLRPHRPRSRAGGEQRPAAGARGSLSVAESNVIDSFARPPYEEAVVATLYWTASCDVYA